MSLSLLCCRVSQQLSKIPTLRNLNNFRRFFSTNPSVFSTPKPKQLKRNGILSAIKVGVFAAFTSVFGASGYATYAYMLEEVDTKTKKFRASSYSTEDDASTIKKLPSTVVSAPAKAIDLYLDLRKSIEDLVRSYSQPLSDKLLPDLPPHLGNRIITLVVDLNETLVHSDWKRERGWRTFKRPGVDDFLEQLVQHYEIVVYSDTLQMYVDPVLERLDKKECIAHRLSRAATLYKDGKHYRDLSKLNREEGLFM